jgi:hypothetical protein
MHSINKERKRCRRGGSEGQSISQSPAAFSQTDCYVTGARKHAARPGLHVYP